MTNTITTTVTNVLDPSGKSVAFEHNDDTAWVLETPTGFVSSYNRILVFLDLGAAMDLARNHSDSGVLFWKGTLESWRETAKEAGVPILLVRS